MNIDEVQQIVGDTPHMTIEQARCITAHIESYNIEDILELGFRHGVSTCYMAAKLGEMGRGTIVTIDLLSAQAAKPNVEDLLMMIKERERVTVYYEPTSYTWRLMKILESNPLPRFDLCYLDGAHSWFVDGFAFFLVDRLLRPGGWLILDDLDWTYTSSPTLRDSDMIRRMPEEERTTPQVRKVYEVLVQKHPSYGNFRTLRGWGFAQKLADESSSQVHVKRELVVERVEIGMGAFLTRIARRALRK